MDARARDRKGRLLRRAWLHDGGEIDHVVAVQDGLDRPRLLGGLAWLERIDGLGPLG